MNDIIRAFVAFPLPDSTLSYIEEIQTELRSYGLKVKWVQPGNIHLTLKFFGDTHKDKVKLIRDAIFVATRKFAPISLYIKGIGVFPGIKRARVLWTGIGGETETLINLKKSLDNNLEKIGINKEKRPFTGHLTLARIKKRVNPELLIKAISRSAKEESKTFLADRIILYKSELKSEGAVYKELETISLKK